MPTEDLEARRWFRQRLADLARQYPQLTTPAAQQRLADALDQPTEEETDYGLHPDGQTCRTAQDEGLPDDLAQDAPGTP